MGNNERQGLGEAKNALSVDIRELPAARVAYAVYKPGPDQESMGKEIRALFEQVQGWLQEIGYDPYKQLTIGSIWAAEDQLLRYECCVELPDEVQVAPEGIRIKTLPGGKYAVVTITKDPQLIPETVQRFYEEYALQNSIQIDTRRPTYEIYFQDVMEYCVPVL